MNMFDVAGKRAIVTGASRGLGLAMAQALKEAGASLAIISSSDRVYTAAGELGAHAVRADLGDLKELERGFNDALCALGGVDILVNCAGMTRRYPCEEFPIEDWQRVIDVNLTATFRLCQLAGHEMLKTGHGKIINVASMLSFFGGWTVPAYAASKGGVAQLTKSFANEWASHGINVNAIAPGYMATEINTDLRADKVRNDEIVMRIPAGRWGTADDMKGITVFLSSPASDYVNGAIIPVDGGYLGR